MMKFFAFFRQMIAIDRAYVVLSEVVFDAIRRIYIPELQRMAAHTENPKDRQDILDLIEVYKKYANPSSPEGREIIDITERVVSPVAHKYSKSGVVVEEVIQEIAGYFYNVKQVVRDKDLDVMANPRGQHTMEKFDPIHGITKLKSWWSSVLWQHTRFMFREAERRIIQRNKRIPDEEGTLIDPLTNIPAPTGFEVSDFNELMDRMTTFFHKNISHFGKYDYERDAAIETFDIWIKALRREKSLDIGPEEVQKEWEAARKKRGEKVTRTSFYYGLKIIKDIMKQFFIDEKRENQRAAGKTAAERVAKVTFRVRFAKWMLGE
jgi:hypothetical protein